MEQLEFDDIDLQCFTKNVDLAKERLLEQIDKVSAAINGCDEDDKPYFIAFQPGLKVRMDGHPEQNGGERQLELDGLRFTPAHGRRFIMSNYLWPRLEKMSPTSA